MSHIEHGIHLSKDDVNSSSVTKEEIFRIFDCDYRSDIIERLDEHWKVLPKGYKINFFDLAIKHEGSSGLYLAEQEIPEIGWMFVQVMFENGISTKHMHEDPVVEIYDPRKGQSLLNVDGIDQELTVGIPFEVNSRQAHFIRTEGKPCLNLLIMRNSHGIPRDKLHTPVR